MVLNDIANTINIVLLTVKAIIVIGERTGFEEPKLREEDSFDRVVVKVKVVAVRRELCSIVVVAKMKRTHSFYSFVERHVVGLVDTFVNCMVKDLGVIGVVCIVVTITGCSNSFSRKIRDITSTNV